MWRCSKLSEVRAGVGAVGIVVVVIMVVLGWVVVGCGGVGGSYCSGGLVWVL